MVSSEGSSSSGDGKKSGIGVSFPLGSSGEIFLVFLFINRVEINAVFDPVFGVLLVIPLEGSENDRDAHFLNIASYMYKKQYF